MKRCGVLLAIAVTSLGVAASMVAPAARAADPYVVDIQECGRNGGQATVPAGVPVSVQNFAFVTGTYGLMRDFLLKQTTGQGVVRGGTLTVVDVTDQYSDPQQLGTNPALGWITRLPNIELDALDPGETVIAGAITRFSGPVQIVFTPVGQVGFGPFHVPAGEEFVEACAITAA
jgi:hypothetical protein